MCLTLANANAIIDHHPSQRPAGRAYTRTWPATSGDPRPIGTRTP